MMAGLTGSSLPAYPQIPFAYQEYMHIDPAEVPYPIFSLLQWDIQKSPHALFIGGTGSGKTTAIKILLFQLAAKLPQSEVFLATYKPRTDDFPFLSESPHFADFRACDRLFQTFVSRFEARLDGADPSRDPLFLVFDEWAGFLLSLGKKEQDAILSEAGRMLMLGRSMGIHLVIAMQRPDMTFFKNGARDNFSLVVAMGNLSSDGQRMVFSSDYISKIQPCTEIGEGHCQIGGSEFYKIRVPPSTEEVEQILRSKLK